MYIISHLKIWVERPGLHQRVWEVSQFSRVEDCLVSQELKKWLADSLSIDHHVKGKLYSPVFCISSRVPNCGELLSGWQISAAPSVVDNPILHTLVQNQTKEVVELPGLLERKPSQVFIPEQWQKRIETIQLKKKKKTKWFVDLFMSLLMSRSTPWMAASAISE